MKKKQLSAKLLTALLALMLVINVCMPAAHALAGKTINTDTLNEKVGDSIREKADAARLSRTYEQKTLLVVGFSAQESAYLTSTEAPEGLDELIIRSVLDSMGYRSEEWLAQQGVSLEEAEEYLAESGQKGYALRLVEGSLAEALETGEVDLAAGELAGLEGAALKTRAYFTGRALQTLEGEKLDLSGKEYVVAARDGAQTLIELLDNAIAGQYSGGAFSVLEERYFTTTPISSILAVLKQKISGVVFEFERNLLREDRWKMLLEGLTTTLKISGVSCVCGVLLGSVIALMRLSKNRLLRGISTLYVNIVRGTPVVVQLMIIYYIVLTSPSKLVAAMVTFSVNSAAYVSEMVRGGILAVDKGQTEAGRSLGLGAASTMMLIVLPQTIKIIIPSLFNEFITLLKETSVVGFIGLMDLSKAGDFIRSRTYSAFFPLIAVAVIYLVLVTILTKIFGVIEGRLRKSDIR